MSPAATYDRISILNLTDEDDPIDEISRIEAQLEELSPARGALKLGWHNITRAALRRVGIGRAV